MATQLNDWLSIDKVSGTGNAQITLTASSYSELVDRAISLKIQAQSTNAILNVRQTALVTSANLDSSTIECFSFGGVYANGITSNVPWTAVVNGDWITIDKINGTEGYTSLNISIDETNINRNGSITFTYDGIVLCELQIEQLNEVPNEYQLTYKTTDGNVYIPYITDRNEDLVENWGSMNVISNTYKNGIGTIICDHPIKTIDWYDSNVNRRKRLRELNLPEGLEVLNANLSHTSLTKIIFPNTLKELRGKFGNTNITEVTIPQSVEKIGTNTFQACTMLKNATINTTCFSIGDRFLDGGFSGYGCFIFNGCTSLQNVSLAEGTVCIPRGAFGRCTALNSITLPTSIRSIGDYAFYKCSNLIPTFPNNLIKIGDSAFGDCSKMENIILPNSVRYVGNSAFYGCNNIKSVYMNAEILGNKVISGGDNSVLKTIDLGNRLTNINGSFAVGIFSSLESVRIPNTIKYAEDLDFYPYFFTNEEVEKWVNLEYVGGLSIKGNDTVHLPQSLKFISGITMVEDRSQGDFTEQHIVVGNNVKYIGFLKRVHYTDGGVGGSNNLYITFENTVPPQMGSDVDVSNITNSGGDWDLIKNWGEGEKSTIIEIKYETTDGSKITIPNLSDIWHNVLEIVEHTYGSIKIKNGYRGVGLDDIFSDASSQKIKRIIFPKVCNYGLVSLSSLRGKDVYAEASCDIKIDNEGAVTIEIDDDIVAFGGGYDESTIIGGKETLMFLNGRCLETPKNLYNVGAYGRTLEDKFYTSKLGCHHIGYNKDYSNFYINDKLFDVPSYNNVSNPNIVFKNEDIEEFYRL